MALEDLLDFQSVCVWGGGTCVHTGTPIRPPTETSSWAKLSLGLNEG